MPRSPQKADITGGAAVREERPRVRGRASMREVAERAGVAMSSVSRVLASHPDVSPAMTEKVMRAVEELDYRPDMLAQSLRRRETLSVGFVVGEISNPLIAEIVTGAESTLHTNGYSMLLTNSLGDPLLEAAHIALLSHRRVDGLVISVLDETHPEPLGRLRELDIPVVVLDRNLPAEIPSAVCCRITAAGYSGGLHLLERPPANRLIAARRAAGALSDGGTGRRSPPGMPRSTPRTRRLLCEHGARLCDA